MKAARHRTALRRSAISLPVRLALDASLISEGTSLLDYGCGRGDDVRGLNDMGVHASGWDPVHKPDGALEEADVVNLGYVLNVIEDTRERAETLSQAWTLSRRLLIVSAQLVYSRPQRDHEPFRDGVVTSWGTFQKYFLQAELRSYVESVTGTEAVAAAPGVYLVFRDEELRQEFMASRYRRASVRKSATEVRFDEHRELLEELIAVVENLGRLPHRDEFDRYSIVEQSLGSLRRAFRIVKHVTGDERWKAIETQRREDLLVYLALSKFRRRPRFGCLAPRTQRDIKAFFGAYTKACAAADELLFRAGDAEAIDAACRASPAGKLLPNALYVHRSALEGLSPLLRVYEGCGRAYIGEVEGANIIKLHRFSGKISYLSYPDFETNPHPALLRSVKLSLRAQSIDCYDYSQSENPPILHRKETFLEPAHPLHPKFSRLTDQEERHGLLEDSRSIGTRRGWEERLEERGCTLRGHRLVRSRRVEVS